MAGKIPPVQNLQDAVKVSWHSVDSAAVFQQLESSPIGLETPCVEQRRLQFGENILPVKPPPGVIQIFVRQFLSPLIYILLGAALISVVIGELTDAVFITVVVLLNATLGTFQEWRAEQSAAAPTNNQDTGTRKAPEPDTGDSE